MKHTANITRLEWQRDSELEARYFEIATHSMQQNLNCWSALYIPSKHEHIRNAEANDKCYAIQLTIGTRTHGHGIPLTQLQHSQVRFKNSTVANAHRLLVCSINSNGTEIGLRASLHRCRSGWRKSSFLFAWDILENTRTHTSVS